MSEREAQRAPYGRREQNRRPYAGETYYGRPAIKKTHYGWQIILYFLVGGIAGASQLIATVADLSGHSEDRPVVRAGRYLALVGSLLSPILLIADLKAPGRWYNMLRIFRKTSAMSIGSWTLSIFGALSGLIAVGQLLDDLFDLPFGRALARVLGLPAALAGAMMSIYTGTLLSATSVPLWAAASRWLSALFGLSATTTASAALSLTLNATSAPRAAHKGLERLALAAAGAELLVAAALEQRWRARGVATPLRRGRLAWLYRFGALGVGLGLPLLLHAVNLVGRRDSRALSIVAAIAALLGGLAQRAALVLAGNQSAEQPEDYFRFTQAPTSHAGAEGERV